MRLAGALLLLSSTLLLKLLLGESKFFLCALDLTHQFFLVIGLLADNLSLQVLNLGREPLFNGVIFLAHELSPDRVDFVEDLTDASFTHFPIELVSDLKDGPDRLSWNPIVVLGFFGVLNGFRAALRGFVGC